MGTVLLNPAAISQSIQVDANITANLTNGTNQATLFDAINLGASEDIVLGASEDIVSSQVASPLEMSADIISKVTDTAASTGVVEEMVVYGKPVSSTPVDYSSGVSVAS